MVGYKFLFCLVILFCVDVIRVTALTATGFNVIALTNTTGTENNPNQESVQYEIGLSEEPIIEDFATANADPFRDKQIQIADSLYKINNTCSRLDNATYKNLQCAFNDGSKKDVLTFMQNHTHTKHGSINPGSNNLKRFDEPCLPVNEKQGYKGEVNEENNQNEFPVVETKPSLFLNDCIIPDIFPEKFSNLIGIRSMFPSTNPEEYGFIPEEEASLQDSSVEKLSDTDMSTLNGSFDILISTQNVIKSLLVELKKELKYIKNQLEIYRYKTSKKRKNDLGEEKDFKLKSNKEHLHNSYFELPKNFDKKKNRNNVAL